MKKCIWSLLALLVLALASCEKDESEENSTSRVPQLTLEFCKSSLNSACFEFTVQDAQEIAYVVKAAGEQAPGAEEVMLSGADLASDAHEILLSSLERDRDYVLYLAAQNGNQFALVDAKFDTRYLLNLRASVAKNHYYGDYFDKGVGVYYLSFSDKELDNQLYPKEEDQEALRIALGAELSKDDNHAILPKGSYKASSELKNGTIYLSQAAYVRCELLNDRGLIEKGVVVALKEGTAEVKEDAKGYSVVVDCVLSDDSKVRVEYVGELAFRNLDKKGYVPLDRDVAVKPTQFSGRYIKYTAENENEVSYGNYSLALFNVLTDDQGFIVGEGELVNCEFLVNPSVPMNLDDLTGTYKIVKAEPSVVLKPYDMLAGMMYDMYGMYVPIGTSYTLYDEYALPLCYGLVADGKAEIKVEGETITFALDFVTEKGKKVSIHYTDIITDKIQDYTSMTHPVSERLHGSFLQAKQQKSIRFVKE